MERDNYNSQQKGYKNLFLQILQLKNFLIFVGSGSLFIPLYADINAWLRVQSLFFAWLILAVIWSLFLIIIYKGELESRILSYILSAIRKIIPLLLVIVSLYLVLWPFVLEKTLGTIILLFTYFVFIRTDKKLTLKSKRSGKPSNQLSNWVATETNNEQGTAYRELDLEGKSIEKLEFKIKTSSSFWRAGFKITDPNGSILPLRTSNSILFHVGSAEASNKFGVTAYINGIWVSDVNKVLVVPNSGYITIKLLVNEKNFIKCFINDRLEFKPEGTTNPRLLEKIFLAVWGDGNLYKVEFSDIYYKFRE